MSTTVIRRSAGLWIVAITAVLAWMVAGPLTTFIALLLGTVLAYAGGRVIDLTRRSDLMRERRVELMIVPAAALWAMATAAVITVPATRSTGPNRFLEGLGGTAASLGQARIGDPSHTVLDLLVGAALVSSLLAARVLRRPAALSGQSLDGAWARVRAILAEHGDDSLSPYVLRPDKEFEIVPGGLVAFSVLADTVVISADPVGSAAGGAQALERLVARAHRSGLKVVAYGASARHLDAYEKLGMCAVRIGEEAVVNPLEFSLEGRGVRKLRQSTNRIERRGWTVTVSEGRAIDVSLEAEIGDVERRWRAGQRRILGYAMSMGAFPATIGPDDLYVMARSPEGELQGVMRFLAHRDKLSLDVMRRVGETPNGLNEALVCAALRHARERGVSEVSLNYAGLAHLLRGGRADGERRLAARLLAAPALRRLRGHFQMDRLIAFNEKFSPSWRPRYLVCDSRAALPRSVWRVLQAEGHLAGGRPRSAPAADASALGQSRTVNDGALR